MGRKDYSQSSVLGTLVGTATNRYEKLDKNLDTLKSLTDPDKKPNNRLHYSIYPQVQEEYNATITQLTQLDFYSPIIRILGDNPASHTVDTPYEDKGVVLEDYGSELTSTVSTVNTNVFGVFNVTYTASDGINPDTVVTRTVKVGLPPDATINGDNPYKLERFDIYNDDGITVNDSNSALTSTTSTVDNTQAGIYTVNYVVSNPAFTEVFSRRVIVEDTVPPVITIVGDNPYTLERFDVYNDQGATVDLGSELTNTDLSNVQNTNIGTFDIVYTAYDGNTTVTATRTVNVVDTAPPVLNLIGGNTLTLERFAVYNDPGATVDEGTTLTTDLSNVSNVLQHGSSFDVVYTASDGNTAHDVTLIRTVTIADTTPPSLQLLGDNPFVMDIFGYFPDLDPGYIIDEGTTLVSKVSNINNTQVGVYQVDYTASDGVNPDVTLRRIVVINDDIPPVITILGDNPYILERYDLYIDPGANVDIGSTLTTTVSNVDNTIPGSYTVTYTATDNVNSPTTAVRVVEVVDTEAPIVTLNGASTVILERFGVFADIDPGVTIEYPGVLSNIDLTNLDNTVQGNNTVTYYVVDDNENTNVISRHVLVQDTVAPVVSLVNPAFLVTVERNANWADYDPGIIMDAGSYLDHIDVDTTQTGYTIARYVVRDGTNETTIDRTIFVEDTTLPVITINGDNPYTLERFDVYNDPGAVADIGSTLNAVDTSNVNNLSVGSYNIVYSATDNNGTSIAVRVVNVEDTVDPLINVYGYEPLYMNVNDVYVESNVFFDVGSNLVSIDATQVNNTIPGTYTVTYTATDGVNSNQYDRTVIVQSSVDRPLTINGTPITVTTLSDPYDDLGVTVNSSYTLTSTTSNVDNLKLGTYTVSYYATDGVSNALAVRRVEVVNPPYIVISGDNPYTLERYDTFVDPGVVLDPGSIITSNVSTIDNTTPGSYTITYNAFDGGSNVASAVRTVNVVDSTLPTMTLLGVNPLYIEPYDVYTESNVILDVGSNLVSISNNINNTASGTYSVTYTANDGTNSNTYTRDVYVQDLDVYSNASVILQYRRYPFYPNTNINVQVGFQNCVMSKDGTMAVASVSVVRDTTSTTQYYSIFVILDWVSSPGSTPGNQHDNWVSNLVDQNTTTGYWDIRQTILGNLSHTNMGNRMEISDDKMVILCSSSGVADVLTLDTSTNLYSVSSYGTGHGGAIALSGDGNTYALALSTSSYATGREVGYLLTFNTTDYWQTRNNKFAYIPIAGSTDYDRIGNSSIALSFDGNLLAFNVEEWHYNNSPYQTNNGRGKVLFYRWDYDSSINAYDWLPLTQLSGGSPYEFFGSKIEMSGDGNCVAISSTRGTTGITYGTWSVYDDTSKPYVNVYDWDSSSGSYIKRGNTIYSSSNDNDDLFGAQIILSDDKNSVCIFTPLNDNNGFGTNGLLELYTYNGNDWVKLGNGATGFGTNNRLGLNASATGDLTKIVTSYTGISYDYVDYVAGGIYTFEYSNSTPIHLYGNATVNLNIYQPYTDAGYLTGLKYTVDTSNVISTLDNTTIGDYTQTYIATDGGSNVATAVRSIKVRYP